MSWLEQALEISQKRASPLPTKPPKAPFVSFVSTQQGHIQENSAQLDSLQAAAAEACRGLGGHIKPADLLGKLCPEDIAELLASADPLPFLRSFAIVCVWTDFRRDGIAPPTWDQPAHCDRCGPVLLWAPLHVAGCPWCWNRLHGVKIPRPPVSEGLP